MTCASPGQVKRAAAAGSSTCRVCHSIGNCSAEKCISLIKGLPFAEVRIDLLSGRIGAKEVRRIFSSHGNLVATCRPGRRSQKECAELLLGAISAGAAYVDIEVDAPAALRKKVAAKAKKAGCAVIVSFHDYEKTPALPLLKARVSKCFAAGAGIAKIACKANSDGDCARLLSLLDGKRNLAVVGMGGKGKRVRVAAPLLGSAIAYVSPSGRRGTADGQMTAAELEKAQRMILDVSIKLFASTGRPIMQSASPQMHNDGFAACGIHAIYTRLAADSMEDALETAKQLGMSGLNVTAPFKERACALADSLDSDALATGAVNTLLISRSGKARGFNTDVIGVRGALEAAGVRLSGANAVVLGAGGAARAAAYALCKSGASVTVANRTIGKAREIASRFGCSHCSLDGKMLRDILPHSHVIVSTLSTKERVVPSHLLKKGAVLLDAFYSSETLLSQDAAKAGCKVINGREWLLHQGAAAFTLFTGKTAPREAMRWALQSASGKPKKKNIALIGFMGSGKSTVARLIGRKCGMRVLDTDAMVERKAGMAISEIFEKHGELRFRALEASAVKEACKENGAILSLGGGAVLDAACARAVRKSCITVWLWASPDETMRRLKGDALRPLFNRKDRVQAARKILAARIPIYSACADIVVGTEGKTANEVADAITDETAARRRVDHE